MLKKTVVSFLNPALIAVCVAGGLRQGAGLVLAYNIKSLVVDVYCDESVVGQYMSWIPLVGGTLGACLGGFVSDKLRKKSGRAARVWVLVVSQVRRGGWGVHVCMWQRRLDTGLEDGWVREWRFISRVSS